MLLDYAAGFIQININRFGAMNKAQQFWPEKNSIYKKNRESREL